MSIQLVTYANQTVTPTNDAIIYEKAVDQNGIFYGCNVTVTSNTVNITGGYGIVCGREFVINSESITVTLAPSGTLQGRLYVRLDLADADAPIQLLTVTGNTLPALEQDDDVNYTNGTYEMELATFTVGVSSLSNVSETYSTVFGAKEGIPNLLWTNDGTSAFSAQTVALDLSHYDIIEVHFYGSSVSGYRFETSARIRKWQAAMITGVKTLEDGTKTVFIQRRFSADNDGVEFLGGQYRDYNVTTLSSADTVYVPVAIYGIRTK